MAEDIEQFGKGALVDPPDERDYEAPLGAVTIDFTKEFRLPEPPSFNQRSSDCCVSCAWSYFMWQIFGKVYSKKDLFCRIALEYGAYIRDGGLQLVNPGQADNKEVPDPSTPTTSNMRDKSGTKPEYRVDGRVFNAFTLPQQDIDGIAWAIKQYKGVVIGVYGTNAGWKDKENPTPPMQHETKWGHALYLFGYHMHGTEKCIIAKSSWSGSSVHHIKNTYFITGNTFSAWTLIPKEQQMNTYVKTINLDGEVGYFVPLNDTNPGEIELLNSMFNKNLVIKPDGGIDTDIKAKKI